MANVLQVVQNLGRHSTGVLRSVENFNAALQIAKHKVTLVSFGGDRDDELQSPVTPLTRMRIPTVGGVFGFSMRAANGCYDDLIANADLILVHSLFGYHFHWAVSTADRIGRPAIFVPHGSLDPYCFTYRRRRKLAWLHLHRDAFERLTMICSSDYEQRGVLQYVRPKAVHTVFWPVAEPAVPETGGGPDQASPKTLLFVGRLHPSKRVEETVRAFSELRPHGWHLVLAGPTTPELSLPRLAKVAGPLWNKSVRYLGVLSPANLTQQYVRAAGLILLSHKENFAYVVAEGLICGCPAFVSKTVGLADFVRNCDAGRTFDIASYTDILRAVQQITEIPEAHRSVLSSNARRCSIAFDPRSFTHAVDQIISGCLAEVPPPNRKWQRPAGPQINAGLTGS
jgi:glycosyltransferase involved in cell wall biosynthesis